MSDTQDKLALKYRSAMRAYVNSVSVLSAKDSDGNLYAMTVSSVISMTMNPPTLLVSVNNTTRILATLDEGSGIAVNLLTNNQKTVAEVCSDKFSVSKRFNYTDWNVNDIPYLVNAQVNLFCEIEKVLPYYTHSIVLARVVDLKQNDLDGPLLYSQGKFLNI